jgi:hypothetical protein
MTATPIPSGRYSDRNFGDVTVTPLGAVTAAATNTPLRRAPSSNVLLQTQVAGIGTDVVVQLIGSLDGTNWFTIGPTQTITTNGTFAATYTGLASVFLGARLVSINTGTPTVTFTLCHGN